MMIEWSFPPRPEAATTARQLVVESLPRLPRQITDALALMVSELATNCIVHARSQFQVRLHLEEHEVLVEVTDAGGGEAAARRPPTTDAHGRGLQMVQALADEWGVVPSTVHAGKTVWFRLALQSERKAAAR